MLRHHIDLHKDIQAEAMDDMEDNEVKRLQEEMKQLKNNFERLESLLKDAMEENLKTRSEYEAKLLEANDKLDVSKAENAELQEKVDILFKLGKEYLDKYESKSLAKTEMKLQSQQQDQLENKQLRKMR